MRTPTIVSSQPSSPAADLSEASGPTQTSSTSSPLATATSGVTPVASGTASRLSSHPVPAAAENFSISRSRPSLMSPQQIAQRQRCCPSASLGSGLFSARSQSSSSGSPARAARSPAAAAPSRPVTATVQPGFAAERGTTSPAARPSAVIPSQAGPGLEVLSPPTSLRPVREATWAIPSYSSSSLTCWKPAGAETEASP